MDVNLTVIFRRFGVLGMLIAFVTCIKNNQNMASSNWQKHGRKKR